MKRGPAGPMLLRTSRRHWQPVSGEFSDGATIVLLGAHEWWPPLDHLCAELGRSMTMPVQANLYVAPPGLAGHRHHDLHHIFALQLHGTKRWTVEGCPDGPDAVASRSACPSTSSCTPATACTCLADSPHHVRTTEAYSTHVTFGVMAPTWADVVSKIACDRLPKDLLDEPLPPGFAGVGAGRASCWSGTRSTLSPPPGRWSANGARLSSPSRHPSALASYRTAPGTATTSLWWVR